jgi:SAP domain-containing protein
LNVQYCVDENEVASNFHFDEDVYTSASLSGKSLNDLKSIAQSKRLPVSGTKSSLIDRICQWIPSQPKPVQTIVDLIIRASLMSPFKSQSCREGTMNEPFVLGHLGMFVDKYIPSMHIEHLREYGLLASKDDAHDDFSPDAIVVAVSPRIGRFVALVEVKSKCSACTEAAETELASRFGRYLTVSEVENPVLFKESIPEAAYRGQLLHVVCCGGLFNAIFVVASLKSIIRIVHVSITAVVRAQYMSAIGDIGREHLSWVGDGVVPDNHIHRGRSACCRHA